MATRFPESEPSLDSDPFTRAELSIQTTFNTLIQKLVERRDQLLVQLHDLRVSHLSKEERRKKQIKDLDQLIRQIEEATIEQNLIVKLQEEQIERVKIQKKKFQLPTPIPVPHFITSNLEELQHQIEMFGALQDIAKLYNRKRLPIRSIGKKGKGKVEFYYPYGVELDGKGNVFIVDTANNRIQLVSLKGKFIREFGKGELAYPHSIALSKESIFVTDYILNKVLKYKIQNSKLECKSELELNTPLGITEDNNEVFVADRNNRIVVLSLDLKFIREIRNEKLKCPRDVKINMNKVFVANYSKPNILVFSKLGDLLNSIISLRSGTGDIFLCFDKCNNIIISDSLGWVIQIYTLEGQLVHSIECDYSHTGIAVTQDNIIVCVDCNNSKVNFY